MGGRADALADADVALQRLSSPILVGRQHEVSLLSQAVGRSPTVLSLEGEAGVGKTRLVEELLARPELSGRTCLLGRCHQLGEPFPLGPIVDALRSAALPAAELPPVVGALHPLLPELAHDLPEPLESLDDRRAEQHRLFRAVRELLNALGPTLLVIEDLHWADRSTLELLSFLGPELPPKLVLLCTYRREALPQGSPLLGLAARLPREVASTSVALEPLDHDDVRDLVGEILGTDDVSDEFAGYLFDRTAGLPFAIEEVLLLLRQRRDLVRRRGLWVRAELDELGVPPILRDSILERFGRLGGAARAVVQAAAVLSVPAEEQLLIAVAGLQPDRGRAGLAAALTSLLLIEATAGRYDFRHALARQAVNDAIPTPARRRLHLSVAGTLQSARPKPLALLAYHYLEGADMKKSIQLAEAAADRAVSSEDVATTLWLLKRALFLGGLSAATRGRLAIKFAHLAVKCDERDATPVIQRILDTEGVSRAHRGELRMWLGYLLLEAGEVSAAESEFRRSLPDMKGRPALIGRVIAELADPLQAEGRIDANLHLLEKSMRASAGSAEGVRRNAVSMELGWACALIRCGDPRAWEAIEEVLRTQDSAKDARVAAITCNNLADALVCVGHYTRAEKLITEGLQVLEGVGDRRIATALTGTGILLDWVLGKWDGLQERAQSYLQTSVRTGGKADAQAVLGLLRLARGETREARELLDTSAEDFRGSAPALTWVATGQARISLAEGRRERAVEQAASGLDLVERRAAWVWAADVAPISVEALLAANRPADATELVGRFTRGLRGREAPAARAALTLCRALLLEARGEHDRAARTYLAAERAWRRLPQPYDAARAREHAGRCLLATETEWGRALLEQAQTAFHDLGAAWDVARIRRTLREHGLIPPHRRGRKSYAEELSPREAQVARLAGEGLTNREIALTLYLSRKTVEGHLRSTMRKLGISSRTELPSALTAG